MIACIDDLPNLALSTQDVPTLSSGEWDRVSKLCGVEPDVPVIVNSLRESLGLNEVTISGVPAGTHFAHHGREVEIQVDAVKKVEAFCA